MITKAQKTIVIVASVALLFGTWAFAASDRTCSRPESGSRHMRHRPGGPGPHMRLGRLLHRLELTQEQTEQVKLILESAKEDGEAAREAMAEARKALTEAVTKGADEAAVRTAATKVGDAIADQAIKQSATIASVRKVLTENQVSELDKLLAERKEHRKAFGKDGQGRGRHHGMRGPRGAPGGRNRRQGRRGPERGEGSNIDRLFERLDSDGDGTLTREELEGLSKGPRNRPGRRQ